MLRLRLGSADLCRVRSDEAAALDGAPNSVGPTIDEAAALWRELTGHGYEESAPLLRAAFIDYLMTHPRK
ncbi:hypothetical protein [Micromonospora sp. NPDC000018]|uniref:hypothetical protein n=1 Tax=Micromonospora sp. NPDC000018 TaxID=3154239 RepID=UPI00332CE06E